MLTYRYVNGIQFPCIPNQIHVLRPYKLCPLPFGVASKKFIRISPILLVVVKRKGVGQIQFTLGNYNSFILSSSFVAFKNKFGDKINLLHTLLR